MRRYLLPFAFCLLLFLFASGAPAQNAVGPSAAAGWSFNYKFENERFYEKMIAVDLGADGAGEVRFRRGEVDEILDHKFKLMPATLARIHQLLATTRFPVADGPHVPDALS